MLKVGSTSVSGRTDLLKFCFGCHMSLPRFLLVARARPIGVLPLLSFLKLFMDLLKVQFSPR